MRTINKKFTVIELLVVITVILLLASIVTPSLRQAKEEALAVKCENNLKLVGVAYSVMWEDQNGKLKLRNANGSYDRMNNFRHINKFYGRSEKTGELNFCPSAVAEQDPSQIVGGLDAGKENNLGGDKTMWDENGYQGSYAANMSLFEHVEKVSDIEYLSRTPLRGGGAYGKMHVTWLARSTHGLGVHLVNRHSGSNINLIMADGHVEKNGSKLEDFIDPEGFDVTTLPSAPTNYKNKFWWTSYCKDLF